MTKLYKAGLYVRISKEDFSEGDSQSIENQITFLSRFVSVIPGWVEEKIYADDGFSGSSFDRPGFNEMMADAKAGVINLVVVKDLSRLGRNYLEAGNYLENILPSMGCRFVSVLDGFDTEKGENDLMPIMNAMNDYYLKNLSTRIKTVLKAKVKNGEYLSAYVPYGYKRRTDGSNKLVIDEYAARVVKWIFKLRLQRIGYAKIAGVLNTKGILPPRAYMYEQKGKRDEYKRSNLWSDMTVKALLKNQIYLGHSTQHTTGTLSHRNKKQVNKDEQEWIRVENTHEPILEKSLWDEVQTIDLKKVNPSEQRKPQPSLFSCLLFCADCGSVMRTNRETHTRRNGNQVSYASYICAKHMITGRAVCSRHTIYEISLKQIILEDVKMQAERFSLDGTNILAKLKQKLTGMNAIRMPQLKSDAKRLERRLRELESISAKLYENKVEGIISDDTFRKMSAETEQEQAEKQIEHAAIIKTVETTNKQMTDIDLWSELIVEKAAVLDVDREFLTSLIDKIEIGERSVIDGVKHRDVKVTYKFVGQL